MTTPRTIRIPDEVWDMLKLMGRREGRSASAELVQALRKYTGIPYEDELPPSRRHRQTDNDGAGLCPRCGINPSQPNHALCVSCQSELNNRAPAAP